MKTVLLNHAKHLTRPKSLNDLIAPDAVKLCFAIDRCRQQTNGCGLNQLQALACGLQQGPEALETRRQLTRQVITIGGNLAQSNGCRSILSVLQIPRYSLQILKSKAWSNLHIKRQEAVLEVQLGSGGLLGQH